MKKRMKIKPNRKEIDKNMWNVVSWLTFTFLRYFDFLIRKERKKEKYIYILKSFLFVYPQILNHSKVFKLEMSTEKIIQLSQSEINDYLFKYFDIKSSFRLLNKSM